jgi:hypothetical protein
LHEEITPLDRFLIETPAKTLDGLRAKARAVAWCYGPDAFGEDFETATTDMKLIRSLVLDLLAEPAVTA